MPILLRAWAVCVPWAAHAAWGQLATSRTPGGQQVQRYWRHGNLSIPVHDCMMGFGHFVRALWVRNRKSRLQARLPRSRLLLLLATQLVSIAHAPLCG